MVTTSEPSTYGKRLLPQIVDYHAQQNPHRVYASYAISADLAEGFHDVTMQQMAQAVDAFAWSLYESIGKSPDFETIAYLGVQDIRCPIVCLAAIKCGWKLLLLGPRSTVAQNQDILRRTACLRILYAEEVKDIVTVLQNFHTRCEATPISILAVPSLDMMLFDQTPPFRYEKSFSEAKADPVLLLHSSGSTGTPKIVEMTHGTLSVTDNDRNMPVPKGRRPQNASQFNFETGGSFYSCFPPYHLAGIQALLLLPIFSTSATVVLGPTSVPPSGYVMSEIIRRQQNRIRACYVPPLIMEQWVQEPGAFEQAKQLDFVLYGGGPLSSATGDLLSRATDVCQMYGSAETGQIQSLVPKRGEWRYMEWNPYEEVDMQQSANDAFEVVLHQHPRFSSHRSLNHNFPEIEEWRTKDLFLPHPERQGLWTFYSRLDDLIVLSTGLKVNPIVLESRILEDPSIRGALVVGTGRSQTALILELSPGAQRCEKYECLDKLWQTIQMANQMVPDYARISRSKIILSSPLKPFSRAPKGTIFRGLTAQTYSAEIEDAYTEILSDPSDPVLHDVSFESVTGFVREVFSKSLPDHTLKMNTDFFTHDVNSLKVIELVRTLRRGLELHTKSNYATLSPGLIYQHPTMSRLVTSILTLLMPLQTCEPLNSDTIRIETMVANYTDSLPLSTEKPPPCDRQGISVLLTGSRGTLGSRLLQDLIQNVEIRKIYSMTRWDSSDEEQQDVHQNESQYELNGRKLEVLRVDFSRKDFGLSTQLYQSLLDNITLIIHVAWEVDFNHSFESYEQHHIRGVRSLIDFSISSVRKPRIVYTSSTSYAHAWALAQSRNTVPEAILESREDVATNGYSKSKQAAERILAIAARRCRLPVTILRIGQIAGPTSPTTREGASGREKEWIPCLVRTSKFLNMIPLAEMVIDWLPLDSVATIAIELILHDENAGREGRGPEDEIQIYNLVNPHRSPWTKLADLLSSQLQSAQVIPLEKWVSVLASKNTTDVEQVELMPALKLLPYFEAWLRRETEGTKKQPHFIIDKAMKCSETMRGIEPITESSMDFWS